MTGKELEAALATLGHRWGFGRPLHGAELGRALRLEGRDPGETVHDWIRRDRVSGPVSAAIDTWLGGALPPDPLSDIRTRGR